MKSLYLRIYVTVVVVLLLFAGASGWVFQRHMEQERVKAESVLTERMGAWAELIQRSLPGHDQPAGDQAAALLEWSTRLRLPLALDSEKGERIAQSDSFVRRQAEGTVRGLAVRLEDGRTLWIMRPGLVRSGGRIGIGGPPPPPGPRSALADAPGGLLPFLPVVPADWQQGLGLVVVLMMLFVAVAAGAYPVVRRLTRRLEALKRGVEQFGAGQLDHRVQVTGHDEVAAVASSFNVAAARVEALVRSHQSLLANASHELRSPLARMKMAVSMLEDAPLAQREALKREIDTNVAELDALVEEVLLASRLDAAPTPERHEHVELLGMAAEEAARVDATLDGAPTTVIGEDRLLRRALRNLLENARRYGGSEVEVIVSSNVPGASNVANVSKAGVASGGASGNGSVGGSVGGSGNGFADAAAHGSAHGFAYAAAHESTYASGNAAANASSKSAVNASSNAPSNALSKASPAASTTTSRAGCAEVRVCDRGPGVPEAMRERIFESFFRLPGHAEQAGGVGLGLSLVKQIAERHGGSVRCEGREGGGSCFVLSLPLATG